MCSCQVHLLRACAFTALLLLLFCHRAAGQDSLLVETVEITAKKNTQAFTGKKTEAIDSAHREQFRFNTLTDLLSLNSAVFIRSYGNGGIATTSLRGGSPEQTAILWNGMNIQNTMLGQCDLSMVPSMLFESVSVEYGGSSAMWGSGSVGGSIHLDNKTAILPGLRTTVSIGAGNLGQFNTGVTVAARHRKIANTVKVYTGKSRNDFSYRDFNTGAAGTMSNAAFASLGVMNDFKWFLASRHTIALGLWLSSADRQVPGPLPLFQGKRSQSDNAMRFQSGWTYVRNKFSTRLRTGYFNDAITYNDSVIMEFTKSRAEVVMIDDENFWSWGKDHQLHGGVSFMNTWARSDNYQGAPSIRRASLILGNRFSFLERRLLLALSGRAEHFTAGRLPVTGSAGVEYRPVRSLVLGASAAKIYRQPTLNEMFWTPGGNANLSPEEGYTMDGTATYSLQHRSLVVHLSGSVFSRDISNWILWLPATGGYAAPVNVQQVWSRGGESRLSVTYKDKKFFTGMEARTSYIRSTVERTSLSGSQSLGRQLIYTPLYNASGNLNLGYKGSSLFCFFHYVGYRYTSPDNSRWLAPYTTVSLRFTQGVQLPVMRVVLFAAVNNLLNEPYVVMEGRPMPLRYFEAGITLQLNNKKQDKK